MSKTEHFRTAKKRKDKAMDIYYNMLKYPILDSDTTIDDIVELLKEGEIK